MSLKVSPPLKERLGRCGRTDSYLANFDHVYTLVRRRLHRAARARYSYLMSTATRPGTQPRGAMLGESGALSRPAPSLFI